MLFDLPDDHEMLRRTVREFAEGEVAPVAEHLDRTKSFPTDIVRKMAEQATDLACRKLGVNKPCLTAQTPLPGSEKAMPEGKTSHSANEYSTHVQEGRHGTMTQEIDAASIETRALVCECERSEEHTSELQSRQYLVCRLLLEKK